MTVFRAATLRTFFFAFHAGAKELNHTGTMPHKFFESVKEIIVYSDITSTKHQSKNKIGIKEHRPPSYFVPKIHIFSPSPKKLH